MVQWLRQMTHHQEVVSLNPGTVYWMDGSYYKQIMIITEIKVAKWGTAKKNYKKKQKSLYFYSQMAPQMHIGGRGVRSEKLSHKNTIKHEKGEKSGPTPTPKKKILTTPSTPLKRIWAKTPRTPPSLDFQLPCIYGWMAQYIATTYFKAIGVFQNCIILLANRGSS